MENNCCIIEELVKIKDIYISNTDEFVLYKCKFCNKYWLYHLREENWVDNLRFKFEEYAEWYIGIFEEDLEDLNKMNFNNIKKYHGLIFKDNTNKEKIENWRIYN